MGRGWWWCDASMRLDTLLTTGSDEMVPRRVDTVGHPCDNKFRPNNLVADRCGWALKQRRNPPAHRIRFDAPIMCSAHLKNTMRHLPPRMDKYLQRPHPRPHGICPHPRPPNALHHCRKFSAPQVSGARDHVLGPDLQKGGATLIDAPQNPSSASGKPLERRSEVTDQPWQLEDPWARRQLSQAGSQRFYA